MRALVLNFFAMIYFLAFNTEIKAQEVIGGIKKTFSLKETIEFAFNNSPGFDSLPRKTRIAELEAKTAAFKILPRLDLKTTHGRSVKSPHTDDNRNLSRFEVGLSESIYDNGVINTENQIAGLKKRMADLEYRDSRDQLLLELVNQLVDYSSKIKIIEIEERQLGLVNNEFEMVSKDYHQGIKTKKDFLRFKTYPIRRELDVTNAKIEAEKSKKILLKLIGYKSSPVDQVDFEIIDLEKRVEQPIISPSFKVENHLQYKIVKLQKEINLLLKDMVRRKRLPQLFLDANLTYSSENYLGSQYSLSEKAIFGWEALVTLKYNFLDWGTRSRDYEIQKQNLIVEENELDAKLLAIRADINQYSINLDKLRKSYELAKEWVVLETSNIEYIGREYRSGKVQYLDLTAGVNDYSDAQKRFYNVCAALQKSIYSIYYNQGVLYEVLLKK
ncbi:MAG: TolC family protein [Bdellovibrionales bacterium]|nr:TolC family protein [Bdellovibrionales bacterium]